jgi:hypothetical protein
MMSVYYYYTGTRLDESENCCGTRLPTWKHVFLGLSWRTHAASEDGRAFDRWPLGEESVRAYCDLPLWLATLACF